MMMRWSGRGLCAVLSSCLLCVCALSEVVVGLRCVSLGSPLRGPFALGPAAGAFYSGLLVGIGQLLLGAALLFCAGKPGCRNLLLLGVVVLLLGVLASFSGAVVDGDTASLAERKHSHHCLRASLGNPACQRLRDYQRSLVVSAVLCTLECVLGLVHLLVIKRYRAGQVPRSRRVIFSSAADLQPVSYVNWGAFSVLDEAEAEGQRGGHPSLELPGYSPTDPELNRCFPFSCALSGELPPAYEDIFPAEGCNTWPLRSSSAALRRDHQ